MAISWVVSLLVLVAACKSDDDDVQIGNGVNDLTVACQQRTSWPKDNADCNLCKASVVEPHCDCSALTNFSGECLNQGNAYRSACDDNTIACVAKCNDDCNCLDACYATNATCKKAADARDGCITAYCATYCKPAN